MIMPGPDFVITTRNALRYGKQAGLLTAIGIGCGISVHVIYTIVGFSALTHTVPLFLTVVKGAGGLYIVYLSYTLIRSGYLGDSTLGLEAKTTAPTARASDNFFKIGFFTNALNPKVTLFFLSIFSTIVSPDTSTSIKVFYGVWLCSMTALWFSIVTLFFSNPKIQKYLSARLRWIEFFMGITLFIFALGLLFDALI